MFTNYNISNFNGFIEDSNDAIRLIESARQGLVPFIKSRVNKSSQALIKPGSCFVWDVTNSSMKRWTDGKIWSTSRYYKGFFNYYQKKPSCYTKSGDSLLKRTFSIADREGRKYQVVNYLYLKKELNFKLPRINQSMLKEVSIPQNFYLQKDLQSKPKSKSPYEPSLDFSNDPSWLSSHSQSSQAVTHNIKCGYHLPPISSFIDASSLKSSSNDSIYSHRPILITNTNLAEDSRQLSLLSIKLF